MPLALNVVEFPLQIVTGPEGVIVGVGFTVNTIVLVTGQLVVISTE